MLHHKKKTLNPVLFAFLSSLLVHSPLFFLFLKPLPTNTAESQEENLVFVEYPAHQQIVNQKTFNKIIPKIHTPYLSKADKSVEKETQAMLKGLFFQAKTENRSFSARQSSAEKKPSPSNTTTQRQLSFLPSTLLNKIKEPIEMNITETSADGMKHHDSFQQRKQQNFSRTMDFLPEVEFGSHTLLNTKQFVYYSYFSRMKEQLYWRWTQYFKTELPLFSLKLISGDRQRLFSTYLYVYLSPDGEIQDIRVIRSSGAEEIDSAALHAFLSAAPFPNPPKGLVEADGYIHIKQNFHLYISPASFKELFSRQN